MKKALIIALPVVLILCLATAVYASNNDAKEWVSYEVESGIVDPTMGYLTDWDNFWHSVPNPGPGQAFGSLLELLVAETALTDADLAGLTDAQIRDVAHDLRFAYYVTEVEALTDQIWAVQVEADPGFSGNLHQGFEAAYGPFGGWIDDPEGEVPGNVDGYAGDDFWYFQPDEDGVVGVTAGDDYVGNYFNIDQMARTSQGTVRRYIDISSPWSHAYLYEDMVVVGMAEIVEGFAMDNISPGEAAVPEWWELF